MLRHSMMAIRLPAKAVLPFTCLTVASTAAFFTLPRRVLDDSTQWCHTRRWTTNAAPTTIAMSLDDNEISVVVDVDGMKCRPICVEEFNVTILEATAQQQDILVDWALMEDDDIDTTAITASVHPLPSGDPYGAVLWPAARTLARHIVDKVQGKRVWEVGVGTGLVSMAVAKAGASYVFATDYEQVPLQLLTHAATQINDLSVVDKSQAAGAASRTMGTTALIETSVWDVCNCSYQELPDADLMLVADLLYEPPTGVALAHLVVRALQAGMTVVVTDSPGRAGRPAFLETLQPFLLKNVDEPSGVDFVTVIGSTVTGKRNDLICGRGSKSVSDIEKPLPIALLELEPSMLRKG